MLKIYDQKHFFETLRFAQQIGLFDSLVANVERVSNLRQIESVTIFPDFSPHSFTFCVDHDGLNGGIIYHSREADKENLAIQVEPTHGWQIHT